MARRLEFRIRALGELHRQLAYAPEEARMRQMRAAETLLDEVDPDVAIGASTVVYRITGYRPDSRGAAGGADDELLVGEALRADLAVLVQRLSETLALAADGRDGGAETVEALARRLGVTLRTVQRWRRLGLALHWMRFDDGDPQLGCYAGCFEAFTRRHAIAPSPRRGRPNLDDAQRDAIIRDLRAESRRSGKPMTPVVKAVARRHGRSSDALRRLVRGHDDAADDPIFAPRGLSSARIRRIVERAWRWGIPASQVARRCGRSEPAIHRQLMLARRDALSTLSLPWIELPTYLIDGAEEVILNAPSARTGLSRLVPGADAHATLAAIRARPEVGDDLQEARLAASGLLRRRAATAIASLATGVPPRATALDAIETDLRWALLLLLTAVADELPGAIRRGEGVAERAAERLAGESLLRLIRLGIRVAADTLPALDPRRRQRPSRRVGLEMDKALARSGWEERRGRAVAVVPTAAPIDLDPCADLWTWQSAVDLAPRWPSREPSLAPPHRTAVRMRHGLDGAPPMTLAAIAADMRVTTAHAARIVHEAETTLRCGGARRIPPTGS